MGSTTFSGPVTAETGIKTGSGGTTLTQVKKYSQAVDPASVAANTIAAETFTVTGLTTADHVTVNPGINTIGIAGARASAADTLEVIFVNPTASPIDPASSTWTIIASR